MLQLRSSPISRRGKMLTKHEVGGSPKRVAKEVLTTTHGAPAGAQCSTSKQGPRAELRNSRSIMASDDPVVPHAIEEPRKPRGSCQHARDLHEEFRRRSTKSLDVVAQLQCLMRYGSGGGTLEYHQYIDLKSFFWSFAKSTPESTLTMGPLRRAAPAMRQDHLVR